MGSKIWKLLTWDGRILLVFCLFLSPGLWVLEEVRQLLCTLVEGWQVCFLPRAALGGVQADCMAVRLEERSLFSSGQCVVHVLCVPITGLIYLPSDLMFQPHVLDRLTPRVLDQLT